jgi:hypothetical protein
MEQNLIYSYTRKQAIDDGVLVDISNMAQEAGIIYPVALTAAVWERCVAVPDSLEGFQDEDGRLWDVLWCFRVAASAKRNEEQILFHVIVRNSLKTAETVALKAICGPGDTHEPVLTMMLPNED